MDTVRAQKDEKRKGNGPFHQSNFLHFHDFEWPLAAAVVVIGLIKLDSPHRRRKGLSLISLGVTNTLCHISDSVGGCKLHY